MHSALGIIFFTWIFYRLFFSKKDKTTYAPSSEELMDKYPFLRDPEEPNAHTYKKPEQTNIQINITNNHFHIKEAENRHQ